MPRSVLMVRKLVSHIISVSSIFTLFSRYVAVCQISVKLI